MTRWTVLFTFLLLFCSHFVICSSIPSKPKKDRVLLISFDGFRWNYLERTPTPNFDRIVNNGVKAVKGLKNAFITKTFPNHFTLVTGQWEEAHGIVANHMYDPLLHETFSPQNKSENMDPAWFDVGGEPIWVTNQLQRKDGKSGVIMWVGGEAPIKNVLPTNLMGFNASVKNETKIDTIIKWFKEDNVNLGLIYFDQPDDYAHLFGPESEQVTRMIGGLDNLIGYLLRRLEEENMIDDTNIIITSDHGFTSTPENKRIDIGGIVNPKSFILESSTPVAGIWPLPGFYDAILSNLTSFSKKNGHFTVYAKEDIPERFHYTHNRRIPPIIAVAEDHYTFGMGAYVSHDKGNHGYDNRLQDMHPFFVAMGPGFRSGVTVETFESVDVYPMLCHLLDLKPAPNNGSLDAVKSLLVEDGLRHDVVDFLRKNQVGTVIVAVVLLAGLVTAAFIFVNESRKRQRALANGGVPMDDVQVSTECTSNKTVPSYNSAVIGSDVPLLQDQDFRH